jgi:hypothetical protein
MKIPKLSLAVAVFATFLAGCETTYPNKAFVRRGPNYRASMPEVDRLGVFIDAAVLYDRVSTNYYDIEDSQAAIANLSQETEADLRAKNYDIAQVDFPFVASFKAADGSFPVAQGRKDDPSPRNSPFFLKEEIKNDPNYQEALIAASRSVLEALQNRGEFPTETLRSSSNTLAALSTIRAQKNLRYLLIIQGNGNIVSGGKQVGQEIGTSLVSSLLTMGMVTVSARNISWLDTYASLLDLQNSEVLWSNSLRLAPFNPANPDHYKSRQWAHNVLYWLPPRGASETPIKN